MYRFPEKPSLYTTRNTMRIVISFKEYNTSHSSTKSSPVTPLLYMLVMSSNLGFLSVFPARGHPDNDRCVENDPLTCPIPSQPGVGQFTPSNFIAVAAATAALCCSTVPPDSKILVLFRFAIGHPDALKP